MAEDKETEGSQEEETDGENVGKMRQLNLMRQRLMRSRLVA